MHINPLVYMGIKLWEEYQRITMRQLTRCFSFRRASSHQSAVVVERQSTPTAHRLMDGSSSVMAYYNCLFTFTIAKIQACMVLFSTT